LRWPGAGLRANPQRVLDMNAQLCRGMATACESDESALLMSGRRDHVDLSTPIEARRT